MTSEAELLAGSDRVFVELPAGTGKTELLARAVAFAKSDGRQLILTHTHAGVHALRERLRRNGVSPSDYHLATIAGWALRWGANYPVTSGLETDTPETPPEWGSVYNGLRNVLENHHLAATIARSYGGVFVDEYQDCTLSQHEAVLQLADSLPVRVLGDPLQGIFRFTGEEVRWSVDVAQQFSRLDIEVTPWRWAESNPDLGSWLSDLRSALVSGTAIDLRNTPVAWIPQVERWSQIARAKALAAKHEDESIVALLKWSGQCHSLSAMLGGAYGAMDELEGRDFLAGARSIDAANDGFETALALIEIASDCFAKLPSSVKTLKKAVTSGKVSPPRSNSPVGSLRSAILEVIEEPSAASLLAAAQEFEALPEAFVTRPDYWQATLRSLRVWQEEVLNSCADAAQLVRERTRAQGRTPQLRTVSRPLLVKGLEYDHCLVLDASQYDVFEFYVAATRGRSSLTVLSSDPLIQFDAPDL